MIHIGTAIHVHLPWTLIWWWLRQVREMRMAFGTVR